MIFDLPKGQAAMSTFATRAVSHTNSGGNSKHRRPTPRSPGQPPGHTPSKWTPRLASMGETTVGVTSGRLVSQAGTRIRHPRRDRTGTVRGWVACPGSVAMLALRPTPSGMDLRALPVEVRSLSRSEPGRGTAPQLKHRSHPVGWLRAAARKWYRGRSSSKDQTSNSSFVK